jgi:hypothetical protein
MDLLEATVLKVLVWSYHENIYIYIYMYVCVCVCVCMYKCVS